jgi:hypothetical protein
MVKPIEKKVKEGARKDYSEMPFPKPVKKQRKGRK